MSIKSFIIIFILSIVVTYGVSFVDSLVKGTFLAGTSGFPFEYSRGTLFGQGSIDYIMLIIDIAIWFLVILGFWKLLSKLFKK